MAEARDFYHHAHVTDDLGNLFLPSDHVAFRVLLKTNSAHSPRACDSIQRRLARHPVFCSILKQLQRDNAFEALAGFKSRIGKARTGARYEVVRATRATTMRAHRNRHLARNVRCCEAWESVCDVLAVLHSYASTITHWTRSLPILHVAAWQIG